MLENGADRGHVHKRTLPHLVKKHFAHRRASLKRSYGLSQEQTAALFVRQNGRCRICAIRFVEVGRKATQVDHDHKTGRVRGLLCRGCNLTLGFAKDDPDRLRKAAEYLERFKEYTEP